MEWAMAPNPKPIFWLKGMAGTGKSTISRTVAKLLTDTNHLGGSFFFKRGEGDRGNAKRFFPRLVKQVVLCPGISGMSPYVQNAIRKDPEIDSKSLGEQFDKLLLQPLLDLDRYGQQTQITMIIVVDALDECEHDRDVINIVRLLPLLQKTKTVRLRVLLTSRPELPIRLGFSDITDHDHQDFALHDISDEVTEGDIRLFLTDRFTRIRSDRKISEGWPSDDVIQKLVRMSTPLFISAATVCRYIENSTWEPVSRLTELLQNQARYTAKMDKTYLPILTRLLNDPDNDKPEKEKLLQEFQKVVGVIILFAVPLSVNALSHFLNIETHLISNRLNLCHSVLNVPTDQDLPVRILHLSFRDFLVQSKSRFQVKKPDKHKRIALYCLETMRNHLKKNICHLQSPGLYRVEVDPESLRQCLPPELQYSCRYWIHHFEHSEKSITEIENLSNFLYKHFLHWVEAMSLLGFAAEVVVMLDLLQMIIPDDRHVAISDFLQDAKRFMLKNRQIADVAPLQIYCAGLVFAPQTSIIRREFKSEIPTWISQLPQVSERWSAELQTLEGHSKQVHVVAFSSDSRLIASGSGDQTIKIWDTVTGLLNQTLTGHRSPVYSVVFSPDGRQLASISCGDNSEVRLWDMATGGMHQILEGHSDVHSESVNGVEFSNHSRILASFSADRTIKLWDTATGSLLHTLHGHTESVISVAFSSDSRLLASVSGGNSVKFWNTATGALHRTLRGHSKSLIPAPDNPFAPCSPDSTFKFWKTATDALCFAIMGNSKHCKFMEESPDGQFLANASYFIVQIWDTTTGSLLHTLHGHTERLKCVAFSPDSRTLASGSEDKTIKLWNPATGVLQQTLEVYSWVESVLFSLDGRLLASGSWDNSVKLWDTVAGTLRMQTECHSDTVRSLEFSPNGQLLVSCSCPWDPTMMLWDRSTGMLIRSLEGHKEDIVSWAFSPDSLLLASGSNDNTIMLWDTTTGSLLHTLEGHSERVNSVVFSSDSRLLASGSLDNSVRLWDTATGTLHRTLEGHSESVISVVFSPDCRLLASSSQDGMAMLWETATGVLKQTLEDVAAFDEEELDYVFSGANLQFSPNSRLLASISLDGALSVMLWDAATGALHQKLKAGDSLGGFEPFLDPRISFSPDGRLLAVISTYHSVEVWDMATGAAYNFVASVEFPAGSLSFSEDGSHLNTHLGSFDIRSLFDNTYSPNLPRANALTLSLEDSWIKLRGEKVLWLPLECRPSCSAFKDNILALGHASGRISIMEFVV